jgi:uncharacterized membrane protein
VKQKKKKKIKKKEKRKKKNKEKGVTLLSFIKVVLMFSTYAPFERVFMHY